MNPRTARSRAQNFARRLAASHSIEPLEARIAPATLIWDGSAGDASWFNPQNWDGNAVPGSIDTAVLNIDSTINLSSSTSVAGFTQSVGTFNSPASVTLTVLGSWEWSGGAMGGGGTTALASGATATWSASGILAGRTIDNGGTINSTDEQITANANPNVINNLAGGVFNAQGEAFWQGDAGLPLTINNQTGATFNKSGAGTETSAWFNTLFNNAGTVNVLSGTLTIGDGASSGSFNVASGSTLAFSGTTTVQNLTATSSVTGPGTVHVRFGTTNVAGTYNITGDTNVR